MPLQESVQLRRKDKEEEMFLLMKKEYVLLMIPSITSLSQDTAGSNVTTPIGVCLKQINYQVVCKEKDGFDVRSPSLNRT